MGRLLPYDEYGAFNALLSLINIASVPGTAVALVVSKYIAEYSAAGENYKIGFFLRKTFFYISVFTGVITAASLAVSPVIRWYLKVEKLSFVVYVILAIAAAFLLPISLGTFQGSKKFWQLGIVNAVSYVFRLVLGVIFVIIGYSLEGALGALLAGNIISVVYGFWLIKGNFTINGEKTAALGRKKALQYGIPIFVITLCMMLLTNIDMIMIKHYFSPQESGIYGAAAIFGRVIFYFPSAVVMAMFPIVTEANVLNSDVYTSLKKAVLYSAVVCTAGIAVIYIFPEIITKIFFGERFLTALPYIKLISLAMLPLCLLNVLANFNLAVNKNTISVWTMVLGSTAEIILISIYHQTIYQVLYILLGIGASLLVINLFNIILRTKQDKGIQREDVVKI